MMVGILGVARLVTGQDASVVPVYAWTHSTQDVDMLRALLWRVLPIPRAVLPCRGAGFRPGAAHHHLRPLHLRDGRQRAGDAAVGHRGRPGEDRGLCAVGHAGEPRRRALYRRSTCRASPMPAKASSSTPIAAVVIGGTSLMGGRGSMAGTLVGVLIFGFLGNILQLNNIDSNTQLVLKGGHHPRRGAAAGGPGRPARPPPAQPVAAGRHPPGAADPAATAARAKTTDR